VEAGADIDRDTGGVGVDEIVTVAGRDRQSLDAGHSGEVGVAEMRLLRERRSPISVGGGTADGAERWDCGASGAAARSTSGTAS
jgi:hypothetical protein